MSSAFDRLRLFLTEQMQMSHIYQPLMLKTLVERGGWASIRHIAAAFLSRDESQIEYYSEITKRMPGRVLVPAGKWNILQRIRAREVGAQSPPTGAVRLVGRLVAHHDHLVGDIRSRH